MTNTLKVARLDGPFTIDPSIGLWTWLKDNWTNATGYTVPDKTLIKFDVKFGDFIGYNFVIVESMNNKATTVSLGKQWVMYNDIKRLQIMCRGTNSVNNRFQMEQHIDTLINSNPSGMQTTYGIDIMGISSFTKIPDMSEQEMNNQQQTKVLTSRSYALVDLNYYKHL